MSHRFKSLGGFTLVEVIVSLGIVLVIIAVVISGQSTYTEGALLRNFADSIGLSFSQAQVYGIGVKEFAVGSSDFSAAYGLVFDITGSGSTDAYIFFADRGEKNRIYDDDWSCPTGGSSECLEKTAMAGGNVISSLCSIASGGGESCDVGRLDVTFLRPDAEAKMVFFDLGGGPMSPPGVVGARVKLRSPGGLERSVAIYTTGQVSVQ